MEGDQVLAGIKEFGPSTGGAKMIDLEKFHADEAIKSGLYVTYTNTIKNLECSRIGSKSKCFCGHFYSNHKLTITKKNQNINNPCENCPCKRFKWIPTRPEEVGMYWLPRRKDFKVSEWRAKCKCDHGHDSHQPNVSSKCNKCACFEFKPDFACVGCDGSWDDHETLYEFENQRIVEKKPVGKEFLPLGKCKELQEIMFDKEKRKALPNNNRPVGGNKAVDNVEMSFGGGKFGISYEGLARQDNGQFANNGSFKALVPIGGFDDSDEVFGNDKAFPNVLKYYNK